MNCLDISLLFIWGNTYFNCSYPYCIRIVRFFWGATDIQSVCNIASVTKTLVGFSWHSIDFHKTFLDDRIFRESRFSDSHDLIKISDYLYLYITCLLTDMDEIWCRPPYDDVSCYRFRSFYVYGSVNHDIFYEITNRYSYMQSILFHC